MDGELAELARRYGIALAEEGDGDALARRARPILAALGLDVTSPEGIATALAGSAGLEPPRLRACAETSCYLPDWLKHSRGWGISVQLYELRSRRNLGIGDFVDLAEVCRIAAAVGADFVGVNPLHALFLSDPDRCSPFSPSSRRFLNPLYIAADQVPGCGEADPAQVSRLRSSHLVDYLGVAELKIALLGTAWRAWRTSEVAGPPYSKAGFDAFRELHGAALHNHAVFEAISARMVAEGLGSGCSDWPEPLRDASSLETSRFANDHLLEIEFHAWLQWIAHVQLEQASTAAIAAGMRIGLYLDLAVGEVPDGSARWSSPELHVRGMSIGAPPDMFTAAGQDWGLSPPSPLVVAKTELSDFRQTLNASMAHAGALRIDHAMGLWQLFFVPVDGMPVEGAYVRYPVAQFLDALAGTSRRFGTLVIGEDLGHVPPGFRDVMQQAGILSYRIVCFEKEQGRFIEAASYPSLALACLSTHDMPTLAAWWQGDDIALRLQHRLIDAEEADAQRSEREADRLALATLFCEQEWPRRQPGGGAFCLGAPHPDVAVAAHRFIARTPSALASVRLADLTGQRGQTNLPGTRDGYPNWRLKSSVLIEDLADDPLFRQIVAVMAAERPRQA